MSKEQLSEYVKKKMLIELEPSLHKMKASVMLLSSIATSECEGHIYEAEGMLAIENLIVDSIDEIEKVSGVV